MENLFILVLIAGSGLGTAIMFFAFKKTREKQADYEAFAQRHGWTYAYSPATHNMPSIIEFRDPGDDWSLKLFSGQGSSKHRMEWRSPQGALSDGEAVLGMPLPEKSAAMMQSGGAIGQQILKAALKATIHAVGNTRFDLKIDEANAGDPGGAVMASDGQAHAMDALRRNTDLARFREEQPKAEVPVVIRDEDGLRLRRVGRVKQPEDLIGIIDLGKSLRADLIRDANA
ncbi:hypothetical protein [Marivita hallyeonensis]|uniref:Uncharacterized protein n=1 Tax=Marivita hallyeonensis TaxID=996342 RepID=A0A1M5TTI8_9RHOB|nr:hypothetical protein [Marivita hallyeonensis]SHH54092.1 hypothetical protein SAMN05443551_2358 [Marivita hallyeonensis]